MDIIRKNILNDNNNYKFSYKLNRRYSFLEIRNFVEILKNNGFVLDEESYNFIDKFNNKTTGLQIDNFDEVYFIFNNSTKLCYIGPDKNRFDELDDYILLKSDYIKWAEDIYYKIDDEKREE